MLGPEDTSGAEGGTTVEEEEGMTAEPDGVGPPTEAVGRWVEVARAAARAAAAVHRAHAGTIDAGRGREKGYRDFVSEVDLEAQAAALGVIRAAVPEHGILAEEEEEPGITAEGRRRGPSPGTRKAAGGGGPEGEGGPEGGGIPEGGPAPEVIWIVDPLDGTTNYLHRHPMHCASVGAVWRGMPVAGAVEASELGSVWWGGRGLGAWRDGAPIRVSAVSDPARALIGTGFPFKHPELLPEYLPALGRVLGNTSGVRRGGSAALDLCYLAQGSLDAFWEMTLSPWDVAAGVAILLEAGGVATRIDGSPLDLLRPGPVLAANGRGLHAALGGWVRPS